MANTSLFEKGSTGSESGSNSEFDSDSSDLGSFVKTLSADVQRQIFPNINMVGSRENENATLNSIAGDQKPGDTTTDAGEESKLLKRCRKRNIDSLTVLAVEQQFGKPFCKAAESFGVSTSTLKRFCRSNGIFSWPMPDRRRKTNHAPDPKWSHEVMVKATSKHGMIMFRFPTSSGLLELKNEVAQRLDLKGEFNIKYKDEENDLLLITCDSDLHNLPEFLASNTNTSVKLLVDSLTMSAAEQNMVDFLSRYAFCVRGSTSKCFDQDNGKHSWPKPNQSKKFNHATDPKWSQEVMVKATFKHDMIKFRFPTSSGLLELKNEVAKRLDLKGIFNIRYKDEDNDLLLITCDVDLHNLPEFLASNTNTSVKFLVDSLTMLEVEQHVGKPSSQAADSCGGASKTTLKLFCQENGKHSLPKPNQSKKANHATDPKRSQEVMVKATFERDMIKFRFPTISGLLELKNEVAQRLHLKGKFNIKYKDEDNDLILITCDVDLHNLPEFLASNTNTSVKLHIKLVSE